MFIALIKALLFLICLLPLLFKLNQLFMLQVSPDPGGEIIDFTGLWAFNFLIITLAISPLHRFFAHLHLLKFRRLFGLFSFFYALLHGLGVMTFMLGWNWEVFIIEFVERPYIRYGLLAFILLLPMALTSNQFSIRLLKKRWRLLHYSIYPAAILVAVHYWLQVRSDYQTQLIYALLVILLLAYRIRILFFKKK